MEKILDCYYPVYVGIREEKKRCSWALTEPLISYHDDVYGDIKTTDSAIFEQLCLEMFGAGRVTVSVIEKRDALREAFAGYDIRGCALLSDRSIEHTARTFGLSRNKVSAVRENARRAAGVVREYGSLFRFFYGHNQPERLLFALRSFGFTCIGVAAAAGLMKNLGIIEAHDRNCYKRSSGAEEH
jgi:DNA-3-methyladenine glycosylase I